MQFAKRARTRCGVLFTKWIAGEFRRLFTGGSHTKIWYSFYRGHAHGNVRDQYRGKETIADGIGSRKGLVEARIEWNYTIRRSNFPYDILRLCVYIMRRSQSTRFPYRICNKQWKKKSFLLDSVVNTRAIGTRLEIHPHPCKQHCVQEDRTHGSNPLLYVSTVDTRHPWIPWAARRAPSVRP